MGIIINDKLEKYNKYIKDHLNYKRYIHSIGVSHTAACLAMRYNEDITKARIAGMLHDCAKGIDKIDLINLCKNNGIEVTPSEKLSPELLHSKYGSFIAENKFGIKDEDILNSIYFHTTGRPNMSTLEKIIFVSDYIEPNRSPLPNLDYIRALAFTNINKCICEICKGTVSFLESKNSNIDVSTMETYNYYKEYEKE